MSQISQEDEFGRWKVTRERSTNHFGSDTYRVRAEGERALEIGTGKNGRKLARTLAAALDKAGYYDNSAIPPELGPDRYEDDEWESWAGESLAIPARIVGTGPAPVAAWLKVVHRQREGWIANRLDVKEATVRQYLSDLREGRR